MAATSTGSRVSGFFSWWGEELAGLLPGTRTQADAASVRTVIGIEANGLRLIEAAKSGGRGAPPAPEGVVSAGEMLAYLGNLVRGRRAPGAVGLRLPHGACFVRRVELPAGARRDVGRLLAMELERSTPFKARDVLTAQDIDPTPTAKGMLQVRHLIIKRKTVDKIKADIEALGLTVSRIDCTGENGLSALPVNFLAVESATSAAPKPAGMAAPLLAMLACGLAASATYMFIERHERALESLQAQAAKLKALTQAQKDAMAKTQTAFAEIANYQKLRSESVSRVVVLEELTKLLPNTAWVTDLKIDGSTVDITGLAVSAAALVPLLERSKVFVDATSTTSLTFDPREEKERFAIRARIRPAASDSARPQREQAP
jgi:general secretion pathway protein L